MEVEVKVNPRSFFYPPGGILLWIIIYLELLTYAIAFAALAYYGSQERADFHRDSLLLNKGIAAFNTILLLTSGYLVARGVKEFKVGNNQKTARLFGWAILAGTGFLLLKAYDYYTKIDAGLGMDHSSFFTFYWLLTAFHWVHVLVGLIILFVIRFTLLKKKDESKLEDVEASAAFWHMCDIIWLLLFPILYLLF